LLEEGRCLEAFDDPTDCPNTELDDAAGVDAATSDGADEPASEEQASENGPAEPPAVVSFGGDVALGLSQANDLRAERPATVVLLAGETSAGKTTLIVELFEQFLKGPFGGWGFAGSRTLRAIDERHGPSRASSGRGSPDTKRTPDEGIAFLHLALSGDQRVDLLLSDLSGELFQNIVDGASVGEQVPIALSCDVCVVLIDGSLMTSVSTRERAFSRARRLLGGLTQAGGLVGGTRVVVAATKSDLWASDAAADIATRLEALVGWVRELGLDASSLTVSARPPADKARVGLAEVLDLLSHHDVPHDLPANARQEIVGRRFWQDRDV
jgi:hypothetical protein